MKYLLAQQQIEVGGGKTLKGFGALGFETTDISQSASIFDTIVSTAVGIMTVVASVWFIFQLITAAIAWIGAEGDKAKVEEARKKITNSLIGLIIVISAVFLVSVIGNILGLSLLTPGEVLQNLGI